MFEFGRFTIPYAALNYLQTDNVLTSKKSRVRFHRTP